VGGRPSAHLRVVGAADEDADPPPGQRLEGVLVRDVVRRRTADVVALEVERVQ